MKSSILSSSHTELIRQLAFQSQCFLSHTPEPSTHTPACIYTVPSSSSLACTIKPCLSHQSENVSRLLSSVINGTQHQAERHTGRTMSILNGHYSYKSPIVMLDNRQGLDTDKVNLCTFCSNIRACFWSEGFTNGGEFRNMDCVANRLYSDPHYICEVELVRDL